MTRFDRYLISKFLFNLVWSLLAFWVVFVIVDLVEHLDKFIDKGVPAQYVALYYVYFSPYVLILVAPIAVLLATLFAVGFLSKRNELLAMRASGVSLWRLSFPFLGMGVIVAAAVFGAGDTIYPWTEMRRGELRDQYIKGTAQPTQIQMQNLYATGDGGRVFFFRTFNTKQRSGTAATVQTFTGGRIVESVEMKRLAFVDSVWVGYNGDRRVFATSGDTATSYESFDSTAFSAWTETPDDFVHKRINPQEMNYASLAQTVKRIRRTGGEAAAEETELALKIAFPLINVLVVLVGFPIAARTRQSGMALNFGIAMAVTFVLRVLYEIFRSLGHNGEVDPYLAAWAPNLVCLGFGMIALWRTRR